MKILTLHLKKKWFNMIKAGIKKEEYREMSWYWSNRLYKKGDFVFNEYDMVRFQWKYPPKGDTENTIEFKDVQIHVGYGKEEWGAEKWRQYFIITWNNPLPIIKFNFKDKQIQKIKEFKK